MPELPELEAIKEYLQQHLIGRRIEGLEVLKPIVVRNLSRADPSTSWVDRRFAAVDRRGKFLIFSVERGDHLVINPMLTGRLYWVPREERRLVKTFFILHLEDGQDLRYVDDKTMGRAYFTENLSLVPGFAEQGLEALSPEVALEVFRERLKEHRGEIKGILTNQSFLAGIGNAYADEILWAARLYPFRRRPQLSPEEIERLYQAMRSVLKERIEIVRGQMGDDIHLKFREDLAVHGKRGQPCPRCGNPISEVKVRNRATNFCRNCQPGIMIGRSRRLETAAEIRVVR